MDGWLAGWQPRRYTEQHSTEHKMTYDCCTVRVRNEIVTYVMKCSIIVYILQKRMGGERRSEPYRLHAVLSCNLIV